VAREGGRDLVVARRADRPPSAVAGHSDPRPRPRAADGPGRSDGLREHDHADAGDRHDRRRRRCSAGPLSDGRRRRRTRHWRGEPPRRGPDGTMMFAVAAVAILVTMALALTRALLGPFVHDRVLAMNMFGTKTVLLLAVLAFLAGRPDFLD